LEIGVKVASKALLSPYLATKRAGSSGVPGASPCGLGGRPATPDKTIEDEGMALNVIDFAARGLRNAALASLFMVGAAAAQDAPSTTPPAVEAPVSVPEASWARLCGNESDKEICFIQAELRTDTGQFLASAGIREVTGESRRALIVQTPVGVLIQPGMRVQVDQGTQSEANYTICFQNACFAELVIDEAFIASMKRGNTLILTVLNQQANAVNFELTLAGFTAAYDGPPLDLEAQQAEQQRLEEQTQRAAAEAAQRIIDAQRAAEETPEAPAQ
jgi:invasion protein IalB